MRKPPPPPRLRLDDLPTRELIARGEGLLSAHDYKDAIDVYKLLLKREPQPEAGWRESLATAYLERARQLAQKAMYREATVLWENIPNLCGLAPQPDRYVDWLLRAGQYAKAMSAYARHAAALPAAGELETLLGALALAGQKEVLQALPPETLLRRQVTAAQAALRAYGQGEAEAVVREHLQAISIRSPCRDLRQALAALLKLETDPAGAPSLVERIPATSPYRDLAEIVGVCAAEEPIRALLALDPTQRELAGGLLGLDPRQLKLFREWARLGEKPSDKATFDFIVANLAAFDRERARRACLALLPAHIQGQSVYSKLFGPLPAFEARRFQALRAEREHDLNGALRQWRACADELTKDAGNPDGRLMAAIILRHMAQLAKQDDDVPWGAPPKTASYLEESLRLDPDDRDTYLQLAKLHREDGDDKEYHQWVERAVKQFPDDPQVLLAAVETATARKAYKKAAGFAARVLELDPINSKARNILINSHLAHARKQILAGKYALACKELDSASQLERDNARSGVVELNRGLLAYQQHQRERTKQSLQEGIRLAGSPLLGWLRLAVETSRLGLEPALFQHDLGFGDPRKLIVNRADLLAMTRLINAYREEGVEDLGTVLEDLEKPLKRAIKQLTDEDDLLSVCECLHQAPHHELLEYAATQAFEQHPNRTLFVYYQIFGRAEGDIDAVKDRDYDRLEHALKQAAAAKDHRAVTQIERFLSQGPFSLPFPRTGRGPMPMPMPMPMPPKMRHEMEDLRKELERLPPALRDRMLDQILNDLPPDEDFPPEVQRALVKAMLLGAQGLEDLLDELSGLPLPLPGRGGRRNRRS
jgi:tetratricopeptide (TPR) repeat protein